MTPHASLKRELGVIDATALGLGSIVGSGVFVSLGIAAGIAGPSVLLAICLAGALAACNALSSAQLAASHPTSGGTYEYGYTYLTPILGFSAGWMFLAAKSASAAAASLGLVAYALDLFAPGSTLPHTPLALAAIALVTLLVLTGVRRSSRANMLIVAVTLAALLYFVASGAPAALRADHPHGFFASATDPRPAAPRFLEAAALMFVAYTGYGRIATLGEEARDPRRTIPRAIIAALTACVLLYAAVAAVFVGLGGHQLAPTDAPLAHIAQTLTAPGVRLALSIAAVTTMLGVLLNLLLGLSRVALAMARRGDLPTPLAVVSPRTASPARAVIFVAAIIFALAALGDLALAWSFSAFTVLVYYAVTNLAALRLPRERRLYPRALSWAGLLGCISLAFWVEPRAWAAGLVTLAVGFLFRAAFRRFPAR